MTDRLRLFLILAAVGLFLLFSGVGRELQGPKEPDVKPAPCPGPGPCPAPAPKPQPKPRP